MADRKRHKIRVRKWSNVTAKRFGWPNQFDESLAQRLLREALQELGGGSVATNNDSSPIYLSRQIYESFVTYLVKCALPYTRYWCFVYHDASEWELTDVNDAVEDFGFTGERAKEMVRALQSIAPYPLRTNIERYQVVQALHGCKVFPDYLRHEHEAVAVSETIPI